MQIVRKVLVGEYHKYATHLKALDKDSKYLRFGYHCSDDLIDKLCAEIERKPQDHMLFCVEDEVLNFIAIGHVALVPDMELAFSVLPEHQGKGLGQKLMKRCIQWCRTKKILQGHMVCLAHNKTIKHMCVKHGIIVDTEYGESIGNIQLDEPGINTFIDEATSMNSAVFDFISKRAKLPWVLAQRRITC